MLLSLRKNGLTSLFKEVRAFKVWSWSSENWFLEKTKTMTMTKIPSRKPSGTYGHGPLINLFQGACS